MSKEPSLDPELPLFDDYPLDGGTATRKPGAADGNTPTSAAQATVDPAEAPLDPDSVAAELMAPAPVATARAARAPVPVPNERPLSLFPDPEPEQEPAGKEKTVSETSPAPDDETVMVTGATGRRAVLGPAALSDRLYSGLLDLGVNALALAGTLLGVRILGVDPLGNGWGSWALLAAVFSYLYWVVPLAFWGQTPGMTWRRLIARNIDREPLTFGQASGRWFGALLTVVLFGLPLLLALGGRSLSDRLSNSQSLTLEG